MSCSMALTSRVTLSATQDPQLSYFEDGQIPLRKRLCPAATLTMFHAVALLRMVMLALLKLATLTLAATLLLMMT